MLLHLNPNSYKTDKIFLEIRFKDSFKLPLPETKYSILDKFSKKYPAYNTESPENFSFFNPETQQKIHLQLNRFVVDWDNPKTLDDFIKSANADANFIFKILGVEDIIRVGIRTLNSFQGDNQKDISDYLFNHFSTPKIKSRGFADEYFNPHVQFSGKKGSLSFNLAVNYQQQQTIQGTINQVFNQTIRDLLVVDLDCYKENIKISKLHTFFSEIKNLNLELPEYIQSI